MNEKKFINKCMDMACHNLLCYSANYAMTQPKKGYEKEWKEAQEEINIIESITKKLSLMEG